MRGEKENIENSENVKKGLTFWYDDQQSNNELIPVYGFC